VTRVVATGALLELSLAVFAIAIGVLVGISPLGTFAWEPSSFALGTAAAIPLWMVFTATWSTEFRPLRRIRDDLERILPLLFKGASVGDLALVSLAAGIGEEILFRGLLQSGLQTLTGPWTGLALASLCFGLAHPLSTAYVAIATLMGMYLGWIWQATGNLLAPIATHAAYDFLVLWVILRRSR
jgi:membrane protease YdiL (CAAX protease family)